MKGTDIPQTDSLEQIRTVVQSVADGSYESKDIQEATGISTRHVNYAIQAAIALDLLRRDEDADMLRLTRQGRVLLGLKPGTESEKVIFRLVIECNRELKKVAPGLFSEEPPESEDVTRRIEVLAKLSNATAKRRAQTLLAWRHHILGA
jgi:hypothetical protein